MPPTETTLTRLHANYAVSAYHFVWSVTKDESLAQEVVQELFLKLARDVGVCSNRLIPAVLHEWLDPRHDSFEDRNVWSLFNAFTESPKDGNLAELPPHPFIPALIAMPG